MQKCAKNTNVRKAHLQQVTKAIRIYYFLCTEDLTNSLLQFKISTRSLVQARVSAYARRPPECAFLLIALARARLFMKKNVDI